MATLNLGKYFDQRGSDVLANEHRLREFGLDVHKTPVGTLQPVGSGGVLGLYDLAFECGDQR